MINLPLYDGLFKAKNNINEHILYLLKNEHLFKTSTMIFTTLLKYVFIILFSDTCNLMKQIKKQNLYYLWPASFIG
jgi:hypothetical protein